MKVVADIKKFAEHEPGVPYMAEFVKIATDQEAIEKRRYEMVCLDIWSFLSQYYKYLILFIHCIQYNVYKQ
jgi:hypothetical protein